MTVSVCVFHSVAFWVVLTNLHDRSKVYTDVRHVPHRLLVVEPENTVHMKYRGRRADKTDFRKTDINMDAVCF
jgi:hypothetical protein